MPSGSATRLNKREQLLAEARAAQRHQERRRTLITRVSWLVGLLIVGTLVMVGLLSARPETGVVQEIATPFTLPLSEGGEVSLADFAGSPVILYFNEGAGCDSCLMQMAEIEKNPGFAEAGIAVLPIVMNSAEHINAERERLHVQAPFALDDGKVSSAYGTLGNGMHEGLPGHGFVLIDADGVQRWYGNYPSMWLDPEELLEIVTAELA
ncbi:redoxin domain-containing protein [Demequina sp.]|uniref:peroxiredoxin family protein n=1 Tax=Demequina sp. TaxID=2050685 RepID=UPI0025BF0667|nr:redoxin domain-containing protein [Demequina sp.]